MFQAQINAYVAWVNAQLKKRPGTRLVEDLKCDMQDGVALAVLIEIVGKDVSLVYIVSKLCELWVVN